MNSDAEASRIIILIMGSFNFLLGFIIKKFQLAEIISGFDERKYDKKKSADFAGGNFMLVGLLMILLTILYYFIPALNLYAYLISILIVYVGLIIRIIWDSLKHAKIR